MAKFELQMPDDVMRDLKRLANNSEDIFGEMVKAGAEVAHKQVKANAPAGIVKSPMMSNLKITKVYKTPSDGGINCKVGFYGYFTNENGVRTPAPLVANVFEYGRSNAPFPKQPFFRKSFRGQQIMKAMLEAQKRASGGLLDE